MLFHRFLVCLDSVQYSKDLEHISVWFAGCTSVRACLELDLKRLFKIPFLQSLSFQFIHMWILGNQIVFSTQDSICQLILLLLTNFIHYNHQYFCFYYHDEWTSILKINWNLKLPFLKKKKEKKNLKSQLTVTLEIWLWFDDWSEWWYMLIYNNVIWIYSLGF